MKNLTKKLISALMALVMTAGVSVYAEDNALNESIEENAQVSVSDGVSEESFSATILNLCSHNWDTISIDIIDTSNYKHQYDGKTCLVREDRVKHTYMCSKCGEVSYSYETIASHSINH